METILEITAGIIVILAISLFLFEYRVRRPDHLVLYESKGQISLRKGPLYPRHFSLLIQRATYPIQATVEAATRGNLGIRARVVGSVTPSPDHFQALIRVGGWNENAVTRVTDEVQVLLQGLEAFYQGEHVNLLGAGRRFKGLTTADLRNVDEQSLALASFLPATSPVLLETIPGKLDRIPRTAQGAPGVQAIEIIDGSPRGLTQGRRDRARIVHIADSLNLALVAGSDNHGWGRAAPGWTLVRIPGWRGMTTDSLSLRIEDILRLGRRDATRVVERRVAPGTEAIELVFAAPVLVWGMLAALSADERITWILWTWAIVIAIRAWRTGRARRASPA